MFLALTSLVIVCVLAIVVVPCAARAGDLRPIDLGVIQYAHASGTLSSDAFDVNDFGQVTGYSRTYPQNWQSATIWQPASQLATTGTLHEISVLAGYTLPQRYPSQINNRGQFFVSYGLFNQLFTPDTPNTLIGAIAATQDGLPNGAGQQPGERNGDPVRIEPDGSVTKLGGLGPGSGYSAFVNDFGQVTGVSDDRFFLWTPQTPGGTTGQMIDLGLPAATAPRYEFVTLSGRGAVGFRFTNWPAAHQPASLLWGPDSPNSASGNLIALDTLLNQPMVHLIDINDSGQLLAQFTEEDGQSRGYYLLTPNGTGNYEQFRLDDISVTLPDGTMFRDLRPSALNNVGWVAGTGAWNFDGGVSWQWRATVLPIPEPAIPLTITLLVSVIMSRFR